MYKEILGALGDQIDDLLTNLETTVEELNQNISELTIQLEEHPNEGETE